jgi:ribosomal protein S18 acetylase RimI-like enzyme
VTSVRLATADDIHAIQDVDRALEQHASDPDILTASIQAGRVVVTVDADKVLGYVRWEWFWDRIPYCMLARVRPSHQRLGVGRMLYEHVEAALRERGIAFWLSSTEEDNERSLRFHRALGFRLIGALSDLDQDSREIFMRKDLK